MSAVLVDPRAGDDGEVIRRLSHRYVLSRHGSAEYLHLPRTARRHTLLGRSWLSVTTLCGQSLSEPYLTDDPGGSECGTCLGRELGITEPDIRYAPRTLHTLPKRWCAGGGPRRYLSIDIPGTRDALCLMCGQTVRQWGEGIVRHHHNGTGMACPAHGPHRLTRAYVMRPTRFTWSDDAYMVADGNRPLPYLVCDYFVAGGGCQLKPRRFWLLSGCRP